MRNSFLRYLPFCIAPLVTGCGDLNPPTIAYPGIATTAITDTSVSISWNTAIDSRSDAAELRYRIYLSGPNPAYGGFDTIEEVEAGTLTQELTNASSATISSGIAAGNGYYINVVVLDKESNKALYDPLGEYFHAGQIDYYPFSGSSVDAAVTANHLLVDPTGLVTTYPSPTLDRFGHPSSAYSFTPAYTPTTPQCLQSTNNVGITGNASRSVSFWVQSANSDNATRAPFAWGEGNTDGTNFGVFETGAVSTWQVWLGGTATVPTAALVTSGWEHWVIGYDSATDLVYTYRNGAAVNNGTVPPVVANTNPSLLYVGCSLSASAISYPYMGKIDDVRIFNQLLSSTDVANLYAVTRP